MPESKESDVRSVAWLSYLGLLLLVPLVVHKDNEFAKFHIKQGLALFVCEIAWSMAGSAVAWIPFVGHLVFSAGWVVLTVLMVIGIVNAASGRSQPLPVIGGMADLFKF
jgi:uncharacterized membrane protein